MFLWAASDLGQNQTAAVDALLERLRPSLAILGDARRPTGAAALVDGAKGLYLAHGDAVQGETIQAKVGDWRVSLRVVGQDPRTGLVVLVLRSQVPPALGPAISVADSAPMPGSKICLVFAEGGVPGTFIGGQQFQSIGNRSLEPVSEIRFENPQKLLGGALVMSFEGKLLGAMGATLARPGNASVTTLKALADVQQELSGSSGFARSVGQGPRYSPGFLTVAYTPSLSLVRRSVVGLMSNAHRPDYSAIGLLVTDAPGGGAIVRLVTPNGPAARIGIQANDVLLSIGNYPLQNQYDFVQALLGYKPGDSVPLRYRHDGTERAVEITLARRKL